MNYGAESVITRLPDYDLVKLQETEHTLGSSMACAHLADSALPSPRHLLHVKTEGLWLLEIEEQGSQRRRTRGLTSAYYPSMSDDLLF